VVHRNVEEQIVTNNERATIHAFRELKNTVRVAHSSVSEEIARRSAAPGATFTGIVELSSGQRGREQVYARGDEVCGMWWASQVQGFIDCLAPVRDVVDRNIREARTVVNERIIGQSPRSPRKALSRADVP
jgi:NADH:quinone reductase (non-electrogenic)